MKHIALNILLGGCLLAGCDSPTFGPDKAVFDQVKAGMSREQVHDLLGEPDSMKGASIGSLSGQRDIWTGPEHRFSVQYLNGEVKITAITPLDDAEP